MVATSTLKSIIEDVIEQTSTGLVLAGVTGTTASITLATSYLTGPFPSQKIARGSPILTTAGTAINENTYANLYTPATGVITVTPAPSGTFSSAVLGYYGEFDHFDRVKECINRALNNRISRVELRPLTFVPDGDMQGTTVADYWTAAANGAAAYAAAQVFPAGSAADAVGQVGLNRVVELTTSGGASTLTGNGIRVVLSARQQSWYFQVPIRLVSGSGTAQFTVRDNTNSADITLQVSRGNDSNTLTTTSLGDYMLCEGTFQAPATCAEIAPQLTLSATGLVAQMGPVIMFPLDAGSFPLPNRIMSSDDIGNFYYATSCAGPGILPSVELSEPITLGGATHKFSEYGDHMTVYFNFRPRMAVWYEEAVYGASLSAMTDTTTFPLEQVVRQSVYELRKLQAKRDKKKYQIDAIEAQKAARYNERELLNVVGRVA